MTLLCFIVRVYIRNFDKVSRPFEVRLVRRGECGFGVTQILIVVSLFLPSDLERWN